MIEASFVCDGKLLETEFKRSVSDAAQLYAYVFALVSGTGLVLLLANMDKTVSWIIFALGIAIFIGAVGGITLYKYRKFKSAADKSENVTVKFGDDGVTVLSGESEKKFAYKDFYKCGTSRDCLFLYSGKYDFLTVPRSAFGDFTAAYELIKDRIKKP